MILYFMRHGAAEPVGPAGDASRRLTESGRDAVRRAAAALVARGPRPSRILTSPLARARETAALVSAGCDPPAPVQERRSLGGGVDPTTLACVVGEETQKPPEGAALLFVGHQPDLGNLAGFLTVGDLKVAPTPTGVRSTFPAGGVVALEFEGPVAAACGKVVWTWNP